MRLSKLLIMLGLCSGLASIANAGETPRDNVLTTFKEYEALNSDFVSSTSKGDGKNGKSHSELRKEFEAFSEGPFTVALNEAEKQVCESKDIEILKTLAQIIITTSNSANEAPSTTLGAMYICQPDLVIDHLNSFPADEKKGLIGMLKFGFENAAYQQQADENIAKHLRQRLQSIQVNK